MRRDNHAAMAGISSIPRRDCINEAKLHLPISALYIIQMVFDILEVEDRGFGADCDF
jgi:hypothetical protein